MGHADAGGGSRAASAAAGRGAAADWAWLAQPSLWRDHAPEWWPELTPWRMLGAYAVFAVGHSACKVFSLYWKNRKLNKHLEHLPGPKVNLLGTDIVANLHRLHDYRCDYTLATNGAPLVRTSAPQLEVICNSPEAVEVMLKTEFNKVTKPSASDNYGFKLMADWLGTEGVFVVQHGDLLPVAHEHWHDQRKTASKIFTRSNFNSFIYDTLLEKSEKMLETLDAIAEVNDRLDHDDRHAGAKPVNLQQMFFCFTFDSMQKFLFNRDVSTVGGEEDEFASKFDSAHRNMLAHIFGRMPLILGSTLLFPFPFGSLFPNHTSFNPFLSFVNNFLDPHYMGFRADVKALHRTTNRLVREAQTASSEELAERRDMLANFLKAKEQADPLVLRNVMLNFILAGRDTTACTLSWMFYQLTQNPHVQAKAAEEVFKVLGKDRTPTLDDLTQERMPYLHGVLLETLRLHPPVPVDTKVVLEDIVFPDGTVTPAGIILAFAPYTMGRDPARYPDPLAFRPERWLDKADPTSAPNLKSMFELPVFQAGPRYCLGMQLAKNEVKMLASRMLQRFSFALEANEDPATFNYSLMLTMSVCNNREQTSHDLWIVPRHRVWGQPPSPESSV